MNIDKNMRRVLDHVWGPTGSIILHIIIVIFLINFLVFESRDQDSEVEVQITEMETREMDEMEELDEIEEVDDTEEMEQPPVDETPPEPTESQSAEPEMDTEALEIQDVQGPLVLEGLYSGRSEGGRARMLEEHGGNKFTEEAVLKALEWLRKNQIKEGENKGSWKIKPGGDVYKAAITGLGLLTFLAHGETTDSEEYGETVKMAIKYLQRSQDKHGPDGAFCRITQQGAYAHAIGAYAMAEAYALTRIPDLKGSMNAGIREVIKGQQSGGGWNYGYKKGDRRDTSVAGWQVQALKAAYMAGSDEEGLEDAFDKSVKDLKNAYIRGKQEFAYTHGGRAHPSTTSIGVLCLQLMGHGRDDEVEEALETLEDEKCSWDSGTSRAMYNWYYLTQAKFHAGGSDWKKWNKQFAPAYVNNQESDGHWKSPDEKDNNQGPAYTTTLGALTLQVYYRFLPTYKADAIEKIEIEDIDESDEEIDIEII